LRRYRTQSDTADDPSTDIALIERNARSAHRMIDFLRAESSRKDG
jgi:hypothetical protein